MSLACALRWWAANSRASPLHLLHSALPCVYRLALGVKPHIHFTSCLLLWRVQWVHVLTGDTVHAVNQTADKPYYLFDGYAHLAAGLACGLAGLAAGMAIGIVGDAGVRWASSAAASALTELIEGCPCVL